MKTSIQRQYQKNKRPREQEVSINTPDKFYFYELNREKDRNIQKEIDVLDKIDKLKIEITQDVIVTKFFFMYLNKVILKNRNKLNHVFFNINENHDGIINFKIRFKNYITQIKKEDSNEKHELIQYLKTQNFKFRFILEVIQELKIIYHMMEDYNIKDSVSPELELLQKKQKLTLSTAKELCISLEEKLKQYQLLKNELFLCYAPVALSMAKHYWKETLNLNDLIQEGNVALLKAIDDYNLKIHSKNFFSFCSSYLRGKIKQFLFHSHVLKFNKELEEDKKRLIKVIDQLRNQLFRSPTLVEINTMLHWEHEKLLKLLMALKYTKSLDAQNIHENTFLGEALEDKIEKSPEEYAIENVFKEKTKELISTLKDKEQNIICMRFGFNQENKIYSYDEIAEVLKFPKQIIMNIEEHALKKLKILFKDNHMEGFL